MRGETLGQLPPRDNVQISIHSPHARGDTEIEKLITLAKKFQSTPLMRGETICWRRREPFHINFNPLPSCEGRPASCVVASRRAISIHSPHARGDASVWNELPRLFISIHSPHARGDASSTPKSTKDKFQSTPLTRGETLRDTGCRWHN